MLIFLPSNHLVRLLREELQLLQEPGSYVGEVVKVMGKKKVLVKVQPEGKYGALSRYPSEVGLSRKAQHPFIHLSQSLTFQVTSPSQL